MAVIPVSCPKCHAEVGTYDGPVRPGSPIESKHFKFLDGSHPRRGTSANYKCPTCQDTFNIVLLLQRLGQTEIPLASSESTPRET